MTNEELLTTMTFDEVNDIKHELQDKLELCLVKNCLGIRIAKVEYSEERLWKDHRYPVEFKLRIMSLVGLDTCAIRRLTNTLNEMRAELESVNKEYKDYSFIF